MHRLTNFPPISPEMKAIILGNNGNPNNPVFQHMGLKVLEVEAGWAKLEMPAKKELFHAGGIVQGGMLTTLADVAMAMALGTVVGMKNHSSIDLKMNFIRPVSKGTMTAEGWLIHIGKRTAVGEAVIFSDEGKLVAKCLSSIMILNPDARPDL